MKDTIFFRCLGDADKEKNILPMVDAVSDGKLIQSTFLVEPALFSEVPGSPFAYHVPEDLRSLFQRFSPFEADGRMVRVGLQTSDEFRFVRLRSEVSPDRVLGNRGSDDTGNEYRKATRQGHYWVPFVRGGEEASFARGLHFLVNWVNDGAEVRGLGDTSADKRKSYVRSENLYFQSGSFQTLRARHLSPTVVPAGCIFGNNGFQTFVPREQQWACLAYLNSTAAEFLFQIQVGRFGYALYSPGTLQRTPVPRLSSTKLAELGRQLYDLRSDHLHRVETAPAFNSPFLGLLGRKTLTQVVRGLSSRRETLADRELELREAVDVLVDQAFGLSCEDQEAIASSRDERTLFLGGDVPCSHEDASEDSSSAPDTDTDESQVDDLRSTTVSLLSYAVGCAFGRWDIRYAMGEKTPPELPDPFAPLPVCSPGMLQGEDGLPLSATPPGYPLHISWNGILVDESNHADDIVKRVREILHVLWPATSDSIEAEMCAALGVRDLRDYFRKPGSGGFWMDHVHMYSKSHRKAPIYWLLQSSRKNYGIWLYYQRLDSDLLFKVLQNYVEPKLKLEQNHEAEASHRLSSGGLSVSETRQVQKDLEHQQDLVAEIREFRDTLKKAADLRLTPDLDDGVVLNIAPLHDLAPWSEASKYWDELLDGKYPWSSVGKQLEQKGMV